MEGGSRRHIRCGRFRLRPTKVRIQRGQTRNIATGYQRAAPPTSQPQHSSSGENSFKFPDRCFPKINFSTDDQIVVRRAGNPPDEDDEDGDVTSAYSDPYSWMRVHDEILALVSHITREQYNAAMEKLNNPRWREILMRSPFIGKIVMLRVATPLGSCYGTPC